MNEKHLKLAETGYELDNVIAIRAYQTNLEELLFDKSIDEDIDKFYDETDVLRVTYKNGYEIDVYKCQLTHCEYKFGKVEAENE